MASNKDLYKEFDVKLVTKWGCPEGGGAPIITMPNIPKPLHHQNPRNLLGATTWDHMRRRCYAMADMTCEICGKKQEKGHCDCLERGTEVLTNTGWKPVEQVTTSDIVAQFTPEDESISWTNPVATISKYEEKIYRFGYSKGFSVGVSARHRMLVQDGRNKKYTTIKASELKVGQWKKIPASGRGEGSDTLSADERLLIAMQADGWIQKSGNKFYCRIRVKKERKIERLKWLISKCSFDIKQSTYKTKHWGEYFCATFTVPYHSKNFFDTFKSPQMSYTKANEFIDELVKWDGWEGERNGQSGRCYYSSEKANIDFVQAVCAQAGLGSHLTMTHRKTRDFGTHISNNIRPSYNLEIKKTNSYGLQTMKKDLVDYNDEVFCITVPSSYFVARTKGGEVFITGNCHELYDIDYTTGTSRFVRTICLCRLCHRYGIHTGRCVTLFRSGNPIMTKDVLLAGAENAFRLVSEWNKKHKEEEPLRLYANWLEYLRCEELDQPMRELIKKYKVKFYMEDPKQTAKWGEWSLWIGTKEYSTPFENEEAWKKAMKEVTKKDTVRIYGARKKKFTSVDDVEITEHDLQKIEKAEIPEGF